MKTLVGKYRGYAIVTTPPPCGGMFLLEALNILKYFHLRETNQRFLRLSTVTFFLHRPTNPCLVAGTASINFNYQYFSPNAGVHQVSELETRTAAEFIFNHQNIGAVFSFSPNDNLTTPWKTEPRRPGTTAESSAPGTPSGRGGGGGGGMPFGRTPDEAANTAVTSVLESDQPYYEYVSK